MKRGLAAGLAAVVCVAATGCAANTLVADQTMRSGVFYGSYGITGDNNHVTLSRESRLDHFSIIGDRNNVTVEDGVRLGKVEIWGASNVISVPDGLVVRLSEVGHSNKVVYRQGPSSSTAEPLPPEE